MLATVVIPSYNRQRLTQRAIDSVLRQPGAELVQIIVVDDCSEEPFRLAQPRANDVVIRNEVRSGAAVSRNKGMQIALGDIIYLLDSDDYFVHRDFRADYHRLKQSPGILYCEVESKGYISGFPPQIHASTYLSSILGRHPYLAQTSSLCISASLGLRFDESLPKHQDWDFIYSALIRGISVYHGSGKIYFDRSDKNSISRTRRRNLSDAWLRKLKDVEESRGLDLPLSTVEMLLTGSTKVSGRMRSTALVDVLGCRKISVPAKAKLLAKLALGAF